MRDTPNPQGPAAQTKNGRVVSLFAVMCMSFALLIWFKLRMVTGVPRTAYADPDPPQEQGVSKPVPDPKTHPEPHAKPSKPVPAVTTEPGR